jgi:REP element-mobilizing transposase RayT
MNVAVSAPYPAASSPPAPAPPVKAGAHINRRENLLSSNDFSVLYLMTFTCYGSHLPGDARGSFDHVRGGERHELAPNPGLESYHRHRMLESPYLLSTPAARRTVRDAIVEVCQFRSWFLYALHVRTNHVHGVMDAEALPSRILHDWKAYASRSLKKAEEEPSRRAFWTHGGSARRILTAEDLSNTIDYVLQGQGEPLETYWTDRAPVEPRLDRRGLTQADLTQARFNSGGD